MKKILRNVPIFLVLCSMFLFFSNIGAAEEKERMFSDPGVIGEAFEAPVNEKDFFYYFKTASMFSRHAAAKDAERDEDDVRKEAWENLVFRRGSDELDLFIPREELEKELTRLVSEKGVEFGTPDYGMWVITQIQDDVATFERRIEDLLLINKLLKLKADADVIVTDEEIKQKFLNQYNSFESEYIMFETVQETEEFLEKVKKDRSVWKKTFDEKKVDGQKGATWINIMSMEALIDLWKIPKDDAYKIHALDRGDFTAAKFYYGDAVFRLLNKRNADMEKFNADKIKYYRDTLTRSKKYKISKEYFDDLIGRAEVRDYVLEDKQNRKVEDMKKKSNVVLETNKGKIELKLFPDVAPMACENFIGLIEKEYYDGLIFHRIIKDFMIQGGDPTGRGSGGESIWGQPFGDEAKDDVKFDRPGILAMANSGPNTNKSQFFITVEPTEWLNSKHTIFGEVTKGMDVVDALEKVKVDSQNNPEEDQKIIKAYIKK